VTKSVTQAALEMSRRGLRVRVNATRSQIPLIVGLYRAGVAGVDLSPTDPGDDGVAVLQRLWQPPVFSPAGHWRSLTPQLAAGYELAAAVGSEVRRIAVRHPAWAVVSYGRDLRAAERLLADLVDPGWYEHPLRPGRFSRLYAYLGIRPSHVDNVLEGIPPATPRALRLADLVAVTYGRPFVERTEDRLLTLTQLRSSARFIFTFWRRALTDGHPEHTPMDPGEFLRRPEEVSLFLRYSRFIDNGDMAAAAALLQSV